MLVWLVPLVGTVKAAADSSRLSEMLDLPAVLARELGDPMVQMTARKSPAVTIRQAPLTGKIGTIQVASPLSKKQLAKAVLEEFWNRRLAPENKSLRAELTATPLTRERFLAVGVGQLTGRPVQDAVGNAWWRIRMDLPLTPDPTHHLIVMRAKSGQEFYSHFALGFRETGENGNPDEDWVIDPRAPWRRDNRPRMIDWFNLDNSLGMHTETALLSDWLHTQTAYRGMDVTLDFLPAAKEHITVLRAFATSPDTPEIDLGQFRPLRNNCATLGQELLESLLLPMDERISGRHPLADFPKRLIRKSGDHFGRVTQVRVPAQPAPPGVTQSMNSTVRRSKDRERTPEVLQLRKIPSINPRLPSLSHRQP